MINCIKIRKFNLTYIPIPKNCSTTILHYLYKLMYGVSYEPTRIKKNGKPFHIHDFFHVDNQKKHSLHETTNFTPTENNKSFLVVREPIRRFISAFRNRVKNHKEHENTQVTINDFISDLDNNINDNGSLQHHMKSQSAWIGNDLSLFDFVYDKEDAWHLNQKLKKITNTNYEFERLQIGGPWIELNELSKASLYKLFDYYEEDYNLLKKYYNIKDTETEYDNLNK